MKNVLAVTACLKRCSVAVAYENQLFEVNENVDSASNLVSLANQLCKLNNINLSKLNGVITASGPGSFTGIRVAQSFAKGIALAHNLPSASVSYFDVIQHLHKTITGNVVIVIKSEKNQAYYKIIDTDLVGVAPYEQLSHIFPNNFLAIGEKIPVISDMNFIEIPDFRCARNLLTFTNAITDHSAICPLYINAQSTTKE